MNKKTDQKPATPQGDNLKTRIEVINEMIMEIASGNYAYKIERSDRNDELEGLVVIVNMMAEEIRESLMHRGNEKDNYKNIAGMTFVLDHKFNVQGFNASVQRILHFEGSEIEGKPFMDFLTAESKTTFSSLRSRLAQKDQSNHTVELLLKAKHDFVVPAFCSISTLYDTARKQQNILVTAIETIARDKEAEAELRSVVEDSKSEYSNAVAGGHYKGLALRDADIKKIREAHDHILQDLEEQLSLKELAHSFGINEFKLKHGFKQIYGTTIFRFQMDERLKKASLLLQNTDLPLKTISEMTGFKSFPHFSKAFTNRYGYRPKDLKRASASRQAEL